MPAKRYFFALSISTLLLSTIGFGCRSVKKYATSQSVTDSTQKNTEVSTCIYIMPSDSLDMCYRGTAVTCVRRFYEQRQNILLWTANDKPMNRADSVITFIGNLRYYGLLPENYHFEEIQNLRKELGSGENILRFEALLTDSYIAMVRHIWLGRTAAVTPQADSVAISLLESAFREGGIVNNIIVMENSLSGYRSLKIGLRLFLDSLSQEQRQAALLNSASDAEVNKSIQTIEVNLERWRKEKQVFGDRYIFVNIPEFMLYLIENDSVILESKIIVGTPEKQTPEFSSILECFITYPYWYVPRKIAIEEYLPAIQADTSFLNRNNFDVLNGKGHVLNADSIDWKRLNENYFPVRLRQREGPENALGIIKFTFDNPYAVFLHDTNVKRLFRSKVRAFSHGCIRVEKAVELSHYLVTGDLNKKSKYVERFLKEESRHTVELQRPIPIHIRYFTCYFRKGQLKCYDDIYQKDSLVGNQLYASKTGPGF